MHNWHRALCSTSEEAEWGGEFDPAYQPQQVIGDGDDGDDGDEGYDGDGDDEGDDGGDINDCGDDEDQQRGRAYHLDSIN